MAGTTCATNILQKDILEDAYEHMQKLVMKICWKFTRRYGGDFYEWLSEANMIFLDACETYNGRSSLVTWLYYKLHWGLYNVLKAKSNEQQTQHLVSLEELGSEDVPVQDMFSAPTQTTVEGLINHVGDSSRELWFLLLDPPDELRGELDEAHPEATWDAIQRYCEWKLRWTWKEMQTAIAELRELCLTD